MTHKEKAQELVLKYHLKFPTHDMVFGKELATMAVNDILTALKTNPKTDEMQFSDEDKIYFWWGVLYGIESFQP